MKVILISPENLPIPPVQGGSVQIYLHELSRYLKEYVELTIISRSSPPSNEHIPGVNYYTIKGHHSSAEYTRQAIPIIKKIQPDLVQIDNRPKFLPYLSSAFRRMPLVLNMHSMNFLHPRLITHKQAKKALEHAAVINTVSHAVQSRLAHKFPSVADITTCIYAGVNQSLFPSRFTAAGAINREVARGFLGLQNKYALVYVGRVVARKGIARLIKAVRILNSKGIKVSLWVIGGRFGRPSKYEHKLRSLSHGLPIHFTGFVPQTTLAYYYLAADLQICPSQKPEGLPLVILEGASTGLPVVASGHSGIRECVKSGKTGLLVEKYKDPQAIAEAIHRFASNQEMTQQYGRKAEEWVAKTFTWQNTANGFYTLYRNLLF